MGKHDNEDLSGLNLPEKPYRSEVFYGKGGNMVDENSSYIKVLTVGKWEVYFIWFWRGHLFDPYGGDILRKGTSEFAKNKKVSKETYEAYMKYLKSKNNMWLNLARRKSMDAK